mgnify:CR=1 FL=1
MIYITKCAEQTEEVGASLARELDTRGVARAFIAMRGEMGVGKTAFVRGFASYFDIAGVKSPTYTVVNEHRGRKNLYHFDMYRIEDEDDLYSIGFYDYADRNGICMVEWSENIELALPEDKLIKIEILRGDNDDSRILRLSGDEIYENSWC